MQVGSLGARGVGGVGGLGATGGVGLAPNDPVATFEQLLAELQGGGQTPEQMEKLLMGLLQLLRMLAGQDPGAAGQLLGQLTGAAPQVKNALQAVVGGAAAPRGGFGSLDSFERLGTPTPAGPGAQARVDALTQDLAARSPLFAQMLAEFPGGVQVAQIPDPAGVDIRGTYTPGTNQLLIDVDNLNDPNIQETIAEEVAHRAISRSALEANPGLGTSGVVNQANEVIAKTYAKLMVAEAHGQAITPQLMDQAIASALRDVGQFYGAYPRGNYLPLLGAVLGRTETGMDEILRQKLAAAFQRNGFAP